MDIEPGESRESILLAGPLMPVKSINRSIDQLPDRSGRRYPI